MSKETAKDLSPILFSLRDFHQKQTFFFFISLEYFFRVILGLEQN